MRKPNPVRLETYHGARFEKISRLLEFMGEPPADPALSVAFTIEDETGIHGVAVIQMVRLIEPFFVEQGYGFALSELADKVRDFILSGGAERFIAHTGYKFMQQRLEAFGAKEIAEPVYDWQRPKEAECASADQAPRLTAATT